MPLLLGADHPLGQGAEAAGSVNKIGSLIIKNDVFLPTLVILLMLWVSWNSIYVDGRISQTQSRSDVRCWNNHFDVYAN